MGDPEKMNTYILVAVLLAIVVGLVFAARRTPKKHPPKKYRVTIPLVSPNQQSPIRVNKAPDARNPSTTESTMADPEEQIGTIVDFVVEDALGWIELDQGGRVRFGATSLRGIASVAVGTRVLVCGTKPGYLGVPKAVAVVPLATSGAAERAQVKRRLEDKPAPGERDGVDEGEAPGKEAGQPGEITTTLLREAWRRDAAGDLGGALEAFSRAIKRGGPDADAYYGRGIVRCKLQLYPAAIADLTRAIKQQPRFPAALTERGLAYVESGQIEKGVQDYDAAIAIDPSYGVAQENKGAACLMLERWAEAVPHLDIALRLAPSHAIARYNRGIAHEMLGDLPRAIRDYKDSLRSAPTGPNAPHAEQRLHALLARAGDLPQPEEPAPESLWTRLVPLSFEDTVADLLQKAHAEGAFFAMVTLPDGGKSLSPFYGKEGLRKHLTEIADIIGPAILTLKLGQFDALFGEPTNKPAEHASQKEDGKDAERLVEGRQLILVTRGEHVLGAFIDALDYHYPHLPTALFGERPIFGRSESAEPARRCSSCGRDVVYFDAVLEEDKLTGYACPHCAASPTESWIEERMRPGGWSREGFLGKTEVLADITARDAATLQGLGLLHTQIADALDRLLAEAVRASEDRIASATEQFMAQLQASGMRGVPGLAVLPLGLSLDDLEKRLRDGGQLPAERGTTVGDHDVFLQVYLGYQHCPFTRLRLPWSDDVPKMEVIRRRVNGIIHLRPPTDRRLLCQRELSYAYGNLEFLIMHRGTRRFLRGSGLLVHLIRDHHFFEGEESPFRLDPERAAQVLGLSSRAASIDA